MKGIENVSLTELEPTLKRIADALEQANQETIGTIEQAMTDTEKEKESFSHLPPEERFIAKVERLQKAFEDVVDSFSEGEAQKVNYMENYPFASFSVIQLAEAIALWSSSLRVVDKVEEDRKNRLLDSKKEG